MKYTVQIRFSEIVVSLQTLEVEADSAAKAEEICEEQAEFWRNGKSVKSVRIVQPEIEWSRNLDRLQYSVLPVDR